MAFKLLQNYYDFVYSANAGIHQVMGELSRFSQLSTSES